MTETQLENILERWRTGESRRLTDGAICDIQDFFAIVGALRDAWADTARVTKELADAEAREALLLAGDPPPEARGTRTTT